MAKSRHKLPVDNITIFSVMTALANEVGAVNVSQGFPDYPVDETLAQLIHDAVREGSNQYAPMPGLVALRMAVSEKYRMLFDCVVCPDTEVTITPGGTAAIFSAIASVVHAGDEVIVFEPAYDSYAPAIRINGGVVVPSPLRTPLYTPDWDHVRSLITPRTRMIIINSPHNPCGSVFTKDDVEALAVIAEDNDLLVVSDEVYELITFDGVQHNTLLSHGALRNRTFVITSFGKTFHITGWKIGACVAPSHLTSMFRSVHQYVSFSVNTPAQVALARYMEDGEHVKGLSTFFQRKRDLFREAMSSSRFTIRPCSGSYFQLLGYENVSDEHDVDLAKRITREHGVATIPLSPFYSNINTSQDPVLRVCFAKTDETLFLAAKRLCAM